MSHSTKRSFRMNIISDSFQFNSCVSRCGNVMLFIIDNFSFLSDQFKQFLSNNDINWKYILSLPPCWGRGGGYESLVRSSWGCKFEL